MDKQISANVATKKISGASAISALMGQAKRFDETSVLHAKSQHLAMSQAYEIAKWGSKLIDAVNRIGREAQTAAVECQERLQNKIHELKVQADSKKRKILDSNELDSSRSLRANFRLIFGPSRVIEYRSKSTQAAMITTAKRIKAIRGLCENYPDSVITLSMGYSTKTWTESSPDVFEGIINQVKKETKQDWPDEIVGVMNELEAEMPMSAEFIILRSRIHCICFVVLLANHQAAKISQRNGQCRPRIDDTFLHAPGAEQLLPVAGGLTTQALPDQNISAMCL